MNLTEQEEFIRHNIFREELYVHAHLTNEEFQEKVETFKVEYAHLLTDAKKLPIGVTWYQFRKHLKGGLST